MLCALSESRRSERGWCLRVGVLSLMYYYYYYYHR